MLSQKRTWDAQVLNAISATGETVWGKEITKSSHLAMPGVLLLSAGLLALLMPPAQRACFTCSHAQQLADWLTITSLSAQVGLSMPVCMDRREQFCHSVRLTGVVTFAAVQSG